MNFRANIRNLERRLELIDSLRLSQRRTEDSDEAITLDTPINQAELYCAAVEKLEAQVNHKDDSITELSTQLDDIKKINIDLYNKLRLAEEKTKAKDKAIQDVQRQADADQRELLERISALEQQRVTNKGQWDNTEERCQRLKEELTKKTRESYVTNRFLPQA